MKRLKISVKVSPIWRTGKLLGVLRSGSIVDRKWGFVEGRKFVYQVTVVNVGNEGVGRKDMEVIYFSWEFENEQYTAPTPIEFPYELAIGEGWSFAIIEAEGLSPGYAQMKVRISGAPEDHEKEKPPGPAVVFTDSQEALESHPVYLRHLDAARVMWRCEFHFAARRFASIRDICQVIGLYLAALGLILNGVMSLLR